MELHGLEFPSLAHINAGIVVEGLWRDLNHHMLAHRVMARLTLADWICSKNHCVYLLDGKGLLRDFAGYYHRIPAAWVIAHKVMKTMEPKLSLRKTDCSFIQHSEVSIIHILNVAKVHGAQVPDVMNVLS